MIAVGLPMFVPTRCSLGEALRRATIGFQFGHFQFLVFSFQLLLTSYQKLTTISAFGGQYHYHLTAFQFSFLLYFRALLQICFYAVQHSAAKLLVNHLAATKA